MTAAELLAPRYEFVASYPNATLSVGVVLEQTVPDYFSFVDSNGDKRNCRITFIEKYPHLFKKLNWWEKRDEKDMPKKVMSLADDKKDVYEIEGWDMDILIGWTDKTKREGCSLTTFVPEFGYIPVD